ncbi:MAG: RNA polymerase sigma factor [Candidatus Cryptobacteroides sp.]
MQEPLRRFLLSLCEGDSFTADDIAQDACLKAYLAFGTFRGESRFSTWLFRIAYNSWCKRKYDSRAERLEGSGAENKADSSSADNRFRFQALYQAIAGLNPKEKAAILLFYMEDKSIKEISSILDLPAGTVKSLLSRGRAKLKIKLQ